MYTYIYIMIYLCLSELSWRPWCFSHFRQWIGHRASSQIFVKLGEMQYFTQIWLLPTILRADAGPSAIFQSLIYQSKFGCIYCTHYQGPTTSQPEICGPFKSKYSFLSNPKNQMNDFRSDWGWKKQQHVFLKNTQEVLSLLRGVASAVWHDHGGGPDFDRRLEEAVPWSATGQPINRCWLVVMREWLTVVIYTSSTAQGGGGSFKKRKTIGEIGFCESRMSKQKHWPTD